jgi:hypothetical protein
VGVICYFITIIWMMDAERPEDGDEGLSEVIQVIRGNDRSRSRSHDENTVGRAHQRLHHRAQHQGVVTIEEDTSGEADASEDEQEVLLQDKLLDELYDEEKANLQASFAEVESKQKRNATNTSSSAQAFWNCRNLNIRGHGCHGDQQEPTTKQGKYGWVIRREAKARTNTTMVS